MEQGGIGWGEITEPLKRFQQARLGLGLSRHTLYD